jgi:hypothetical protein
VGGFVEVPLPDGGSLIVEASPDLDEGLVRASAAQRIAEVASESFESALGRVALAAAAVRDKMTALEVQPDEVTVEFGIKLGSAAGVVVANASTEANVKVLLRWTSRAESI